MQSLDAERYLLNKMSSKEALDILKNLMEDENYVKALNLLAGTTVYFPENYEWQDKASRNLKLREDFYSGNYEVSDLARKYELSISRVYKIIQNRE